MNLRRFIKRRQLWLLLVIMGLMVFLYVNSRSVFLDKHDEITRVLNTIREQDALLNQNLLKTRYYLVKSYDPLNQSLDKIQSALNILQRGTVARYRRVHPKVDKAYLNYRDVFRERKSLIDQFKSSNAILRNSLHHAPRAARRLDKRVSYPISLTINELLRDMLLFNVTGDPALSELIQVRLKNLRSRTGSLGGATKTDMVILLRHGEHILRRKAEVDKLVERITLSTRSEAAERLFDAYNRSHIADTHKTDIYRLLLFALATGLLLYVILVIVKLRLAGWSLENANTGLQKMNRAFERFVPQEFLRNLNRNSIAEVRLGDVVKNRMTALFCDIRSFTTLSEKMTPEENFAFINSYLNQMGPVIRKHQGFIDKFIGDAIMALFDGSPDRAVSAGILMLQRLQEFNQSRGRKNREPVRIGIGVHTGDMMLGTVGEFNRMEGTVISDAVNLASRLESLTKTYGVNLLISDETRRGLESPENYHIRFIDRVQVKGKEHFVDVYEVFDSDPPALRHLKALTSKNLTRGIELYHSSDMAGAGEAFAACLVDFPDDPIAKLHFERLA